MQFNACNKRIYEKRFIHSFLLASKITHIEKKTHTHTHDKNTPSTSWNRRDEIVKSTVGGCFLFSGNPSYWKSPVGYVATAQTELPPMCLVRLVQRLDLNALLLVIQFSHLFHLPNSPKFPTRNLKNMHKSNWCVSPKKVGLRIKKSWNHPQDL